MFVWPSASVNPDYYSIRGTDFEYSGEEPGGFKNFYSLGTDKYELFTVKRRERFATSLSKMDPAEVGHSFYGTKVLPVPGIFKPRIKVVVPAKPDCKGNGFTN
jgi:hypothetical protein